MPSFFPKPSTSSPRIYAYSDNHQQYAGLLKIGFTTKTVSERIKQQYVCHECGDLVPKNQSYCSRNCYEASLIKT